MREHARAFRAPGSGQPYPSPFILADVGASVLTHHYVSPTYQYVKPDAPVRRPLTALISSPLLYMPASKITDFAPLEKSIARWAQVLAHPARVAILRLLANGYPMPSAEFTALLPLARTTLAQHLRALLLSGLIQAESRGPLVYYSMNKTLLRPLFAQFGELFAELR